MSQSSAAIPSGVLYICVCQPPEYDLRAFLTAGALPDGTIVLIRDMSTTELSETCDVARQIRRRERGAMLAASTREPVIRESLAMTQLLRSSGVRLVVGEPVTGPSLALAAAGHGLVRADMQIWLGSCLHPKGLVEHGLIDVLSALICGDPVDTMALRQTRRWIGRLGLPRLHRWEMAGRLLRALVSLQKTPELTIAAGANTAMLADASTFSHAFRRLFGESRTEARNKVGWEWLLWRFLRPRPKDVPRNLTLRTRSVSRRAQIAHIVGTRDSAPPILTSSAHRSRADASTRPLEASYD